MKKNKKRKQKKKQGNVRRQKKLNNKKRKRQQVKHKNNQANSLKQNSIENSYPIPKRVTTKDSKPKKRPRPIIPRNNYSFFRLSCWRYVRCRRICGTIIFYLQLS